MVPNKVASLRLHDYKTMEEKRRHGKPQKDAMNAMEATREDRTLTMSKYPDMETDEHAQTVQKHAHKHGRLSKRKPAKAPGLGSVDDGQLPKGARRT